MTFEESLGGAVTEVPVADSNVVTVAKGTLVAAHPDCLNGCAVSFAAGTHLELRADLDDANLTRYGIRLTRDLSDVALDSSFAGKLPLTVTCNSARPMRAVVGLTTVPAAQAASMREKLPTFAKLWAGTRQTLVEIPDAEAGTVTFALQVVCPGTQLILR